MKTRNPERVASLLAVLAISSLFLPAATTVPLELPRPDGRAGDMTKKIKVYLLAGQSNMVGMGDITGARPPWPSVMLSADPAVIPGTMPVGGSAVGAHGIYQSADPKAAKGAVVAVHKGAFDPQADYAKRKPEMTATVALGTVAANLPAIDGPHVVVATAWIDVPVSGTYTLHAGFGDSTHATVTLDGKEVYRKEIGGQPVLAKVSLETGKRYPVRVTWQKGGSAAFWLEQVDLVGHGDLVTVTKEDRKFQYLLDKKGEWSVRGDVYFQEARLVEGGKGAPLSALANSKCLPKCNSIGPEVGFGSVMGTFHDEPVLLIKTSMGNRSLGFDFRPPSSGRNEPDNQFEGLEYRLMVKGVRETLENIAKIVPGYQGQGFELAGFGWFQGHKDAGSTKEEYEKHLVNLIKDLRKEFDAPQMRVVVATVGFHGYRLESGPWKGVWEAQMAVGDPKQHPEFAGSVASVDTRDFWREVEESPRNQDYHYNRNAETYLLVGEAMGRAMVRLSGGEAAATPKSGREARVAAELAAAAAMPVPTDAQKAASLAALKPLILDGALASFLADPRNQPALQAALKQEKPPRATSLLDDMVDTVAEYYQAAGIHDYDWHPFGKDIKNATWDYFSFDLPPSLDKTKGVPNLTAVCPAGMEKWYAPEFDAKQAGWKSGAAPFGQSSEKIAFPDWMPRLTEAPQTVCEKEVLLMRQTFEVPPFQEGHRYRIRIDGSAHPNSGEGFALYVNGKLLAESKSGIVAWRREGHKPRGSQVWPDFRDEFKGGKVTLAVASFPMDNLPADKPIRHRAHLSVWLEESKLPPQGR